MKPTRLERELLDEVHSLLPKGCSRALFRELDSLGLINRKACEELAIRRHIERSIRAGSLRTDAFMQAADRFCCSYEKARNIYYKPLKTSF